MKHTLFFFMLFVSISAAFATSTEGYARLSDKDRTVAGFTLEQRANEIDSELYVLRPEYARLTKEIEARQTQHLNQEEQDNLTQMKIDHGKIDAMITELTEEKIALIKKGVTVSKENLLGN